MENINGKAKNWQIALFALNGISSNTAMFMIGYYMFFSQNILGLSAVILGFIATAMRVCDGLIDPTIGVMIDKTNTKFGRFRPHMAIGCIVTALSITAIFYCPPSIGQLGAYIYTSVFYVVYIVGYSFQTTCTRAAQAVLTKDPKQRPLFAVFNSGFNAILAAIFPLILMTWMAPNYEGKLQNPQLWKDMCLVMIGIMVVCSALACIGIAGRDKPEFYLSGGKVAKVGYRDIISVVKGNRALQMLIVAASTDKLALQLMNGITIYVFSNCIMNSSLQGTFASMKMWPVLIVSMGGIFLARKFGLKKPFMVGTWGSLIALIAMFVMGAKPGNFVPFLVVLIFQGCMVGITNNIQNPMIADCADYEHYRSGKFIPGIVGTVFTLVDQVISAFSSTIVGLALAFAGVATGKIATDTYISDKFYWTIMFCFCIVPILGHVASIIAMKFYPLTTEKMIEIQAELRLRKEKDLAEKATLAGAHKQ